MKRYRYDFWGEGGFSISRIPFCSAFFFFFWLRDKAGVSGGKVIMNNISS